MSKMSIPAPLRVPLGVAAGLLVLDGVLLSGAPLALRTLAALLLTVFLPGGLLVRVLVARHIFPTTWLERGVLSVGAGFSLTIVLMLALSYLPGGLTQWQTLLAFTGLSVVLLAAGYRVGDRGTEADVGGQQPAANRQSAWLIAAFCLLLLGGGFLRFANLGYAEFQGDEVRATLRAAAILQGYEDVLFLHRKGPAEILIPTAFYALTGQMTEATARLPFALANLVGLCALWVLGWRLFGALAGGIAALLLAVDGYFIAFARIVQYQSIVFLTVVLVVWVLYRLVTARRIAAGYLMLAALLLGAGLLSHYEAILVIFPSLYLLWRLGRIGGWARLGRALIPGILVGGVVLAAFYVPFVLHPNFGDTARYLGEGRIGGQFPYNNLVDFVQRTTLYSPIYYFLLLVGLAVLALMGIYWRSLRGLTRRLAIALLLAGLALTIWLPDWLRIGETDYTFAFFALALLVGFALPRTTPAERTVLAWLGGPLLLALFFTADPRTHVYTFFMPWVLLAGSGVERAWAGLAERPVRRIVGPLGGAVALVLLLVCGNYAYRYFVYNDVEILRTWDQNRPPGYPAPYELPVEEGLFGFPLQNGWKAIGALYASGELSGAYLTNAKPHVVNWYTRSIHECVRDHRYYFWVDDLNLHERDERIAIRESLQNEYTLMGTVLVEGAPRMEVYTREPVAGPVAEWDFEPLAEQFDRTLSGYDFPIAAPVVEPTLDATVENPLAVRFGEQMRLVGYALEQDQVQPGQTVDLTLYWQTDAPVERAYTVFNQLVRLDDNRMMGQRDGQPGCDGRPTSSWQPGELIVDTYSVPIFADAAPGIYPLLVGMYDPDTHDRLPIFNDRDELVGHALTLTDITIEEAP